MQLYLQQIVIRNNTQTLTCTQIEKKERKEGIREEKNERKQSDSSVTFRLLFGPVLQLGEVWYFICLPLFLSQYLSFSDSGLITLVSILKHSIVDIPV